MDVRTPDGVSKATIIFVGNMSELGNKITIPVDEWYSIQAKILSNGLVLTD
jgi:hypothetical protein